MHENLNNTFMQLCLFLVNFTRHSIKLQLAPTAGIGVFAGRAFKKDALVLVSSKTLFLPQHFPESHVLGNYAFGYNKTHIGLVLDYGSIFNHHKSPNVKAGEKFPGSNKIHFQVRMRFQEANCNVLKKMQYTCMHAQQRCEHINPFQGHKRHRCWTGNFGLVWR